MINILLILIILMLLYFIFEKKEKISENFETECLEEEEDCLYDKQCDDFCKEYVLEKEENVTDKCTIDFTPEPENISELGKAILYKNNCVDQENKCNSIQPYSPTVLYQENPDTKKKYTSDERTEKKQQYENICFAKNREISKCCDPNDKRLDGLFNIIPQKVKDSVPYVRNGKDKENNEIYYICRDGDAECKSRGFRKPTAYDFCKLSDELCNLCDETRCEVTNLVKDCYSTNCSDYSNFKIDPFVKQHSYFEDYYLVEAIKNDRVSHLQNYFSRNGTNINMTLSSGYPGNTCLHEAIFYNAKLCVNYLLNENVDLTKKNKDGNTPLHMGCLKGNNDVVHLLLKMGSDIHDKNNVGDNALHCGVRSGNFGTVVMLLNNGAKIFDKNLNKETALFVAVSTPKKNIKIISFLVSNGSKVIPDLTDEETITDNDDAKNFKQETLLEIIKDDENISINEEIRTFLQRIAYEKYKNNNFENYNKFLKKYPEFRPYEFEGDDTEDDVDNVNVSYEEKVNEKNLYYNTYRVPIKIMNKNTKEILNKQ